MKELIFFGGVLIVVPAGALLASYSPRLRDLTAICLLFGATVPELLDINFFGRNWYRGTSRGLEISFIDFFALILLISVLVSRLNETRQPFDARRPIPPYLFWPTSLGLILAYIAYSALNVAISDPKLFGMWELSKFVRGLIVFLAAAYYVRSRRELEITLMSLGVSAVFIAVISVYQRYGMGMHRVTGPFDHPNGLSMFGCVLAPMLLAGGLSDMARWKRLFCLLGVLLSVGSVLLSISRTGFVAVVLVSAATLVVCIGFRFSARNLAIAGISALVLAGMLAKSWDSLSGRLMETSFVDEYLDEDASDGRGMYLVLARAIISDHFFGVGLNNWSYHVSNHYTTVIGREQAAYPGVDIAPTEEEGRGTAVPAHNIMALTLGELGWIGLFLFVAIWVQWFRMGFRFMLMRGDSVYFRFAIGSFFALMAALLQGVTEYNYRTTGVYLLLHFVMGGLAAIYYLDNLQRQKDAAAAMNPAQPRMQPMAARESAAHFRF